MRTEKQLNWEIVFVVDLLKFCEKMLAKRYASLSSLIGYVVDDLEGEICEVLNVDRTNALKVSLSHECRREISSSS
jgi:hypothetical protein